jgi:N-acetylglucosamine-6-phosphate deacetylase
VNYILRAARALTPFQELAPAAVLIRGSVIDAIAESIEPPEGARVYELGDATLAPGFIDLHVHGGGGFSLATTDPEEIGGYSRWAAGRGVTAFLASIAAARPEDALPLLRAAAEAISRGTTGAELLGVHLEGPFITLPGALPRSWMTPPDAAFLRQLAGAAAGCLQLMTVAPEAAGADRLIAAAEKAGVTVALGHTEATCEQAERAFALGARHVTHAFNAMRFHHRDPGVIGAALQRPDVTLEIIADGVHLHPAAAAILISAFGPSRVALVTDGVTPAGLPEGSFQIGGQEARLSGGRMLLPGGTLAGSAATMADVVRHLVLGGLADLRTASIMSSAVPAGIGGVAARKGRLAPGYDADIVALSPQLEVVAAWARGAAFDAGVR